ncbi:HTH domain-containing protein, partial [Escherichia coli]|nr:HTH domain-containing protein [Escherichia coli]
HHIIYPSSSNVEVGERSFADPNVPNRVPDVPIDDPEFDDMRLRQNWFLECLRRKPKTSCRDIKEFFGVSLKTAKRDIASLKAENKILFKGNRRRGRYVLLDGWYQPP